MTTDGTGASPPDGLDTPGKPGFDAALAAEVNAALVGELDQGLAVDPHTPFGDERRLFAALYVRHRHTIAQQARRYLADARDVDEVVQETFLRLFLALPELESEAQAIAWSRRTVTNLCIDRYRASQRRPRLIDLALVEHELVVDDEPSDPLVQAEDAAIVRHAMALLPDSYRQALVKREIEEKPLPQIAAEMAIPEESVKHLLYRARRALRRLLADSGLAPLSQRGKAAGSALLLILTVIFGLPVLRSSSSGDGRDAPDLATSAPDRQLLASPSVPRVPDGAVPSAVGPGPVAGPGSSGVGAASRVAAPAPPAPALPGVAAAAPAGPRRTAAVVPPAAATDSAPALAAPTVRTAPPARVAPPSPAEHRVVPPVAAAVPAPAPAADAPMLATVPTELPSPVEEPTVRGYTIDGGGTLDGTGQVEQLSVQSLDTGQRLAVSRFVSATSTGDLALHQNITQETDGRVTVDVVPIMFDAGARQLAVDVSTTRQEFVRRDDGTVRIRTEKRFIARAMEAEGSANPDAAAITPVAPPREGSLIVDMVVSADLSSVLAESVTVQ